MPYSAFQQSGCRTPSFSGVESHATLVGSVSVPTAKPTTHVEVVSPKKLIEVALPLDAINKACAREKSIRHGHPSTLHLWWARRPLAAARAVIFSQLVHDPEDPGAGKTIMAGLYIRELVQA